MHAHQFKQRLHRFGHGEELEVAIFVVHRAQAGKQCAQAGTVNEIKCAHVDQHGVIFVKQRQQHLFKGFGVAGIKVVFLEGNNGGLAGVDFFNGEFHGGSC